VSGEKSIGTILDFPDDFIVIDEYGNEFNSNAALEQQLITTELNERITEWLDMQTGKLGGFIRNITKFANRSTLTAYIASFVDPFSKPEHAKVPKWLPTTESSSSNTQ
jgi:hypothetical protein